MRLIRPTYEIMGECPRDIPAAKLKIESAGRTCYKSEEKITEGTAEKFVATMVKSGHHSVLEHSNLVFVCRQPKWAAEVQRKVFECLGERLRFIRTAIENGNVYLAGNYRAWHQTREMLEQQTASVLGTHLHELISESLQGVFGYSFDERARLDNLNEGFIFERVTEIEKIPGRLRAFTVRIICDRGVTHEIVRHRPFAYSQESTRYVNYRNKGMAFIIPVWAKNIVEKTHEQGINTRNLTIHEFAWIRHMLESEGVYNMLSDPADPNHWTAEKARSVLPNSLKTEIVVTGYAEDWAWMRHMRVPPTAHPQYREISIPLFKELETRGWLEI